MEIGNFIGKGRDQYFFGKETKILIFDVNDLVMTEE